MKNVNRDDAHAAKAVKAVNVVTTARSSLRPASCVPSPGVIRAWCGFTLIELIITVAIVAIIASAALPLAQLTVQRAKEQELRSALREIREAIDSYKQAADEARVVRTADASGYPPSLDALVLGVDDAKLPVKKSIYFLRRLPRDPFAPDDLPSAQTWGKRSYDNPPDNPRGGKDVFDVFSLSEGRGLNGIVYREW